MFAYRLSDLELRGIIENAFLPLRCHCTVAPDNSMTVEIIEPDTDRVQVVRSGIALDRLDTSRAINDLVAELRQHLEQRRHTHSDMHYRFG